MKVLLYLIVLVSLLSCKKGDETSMTQKYLKLFQESQAQLTDFNKTPLVIIDTGSEFAINRHQEIYLERDNTTYQYCDNHFERIDGNYEPVGPGSFYDEDSIHLLPTNKRFSVSGFYQQCQLTILSLDSVNFEYDPNTGLDKEFLFEVNSHGLIELCTIIDYRVSDYEPPHYSIKPIYHYDEEPNCDEYHYPHYNYATPGMSRI